MTNHKVKDLNRLEILWVSKSGNTKKKHGFAAGMNSSLNGMKMIFLNGRIMSDKISGK